MTHPAEYDTIDLERGRQAAPQIFEELRKRIVSLRLPPGTVLSRASLMEQFRVSQTPIRDALLKLAEEKLVDIFAQHSTVVSSIDVNQAKQAHFLRQAVELEVVRRLCAVEDRGFVRPIEDELQRQKDALQRGDIVDLRERDLTFHHRLCVAADVPDLWRLISSRSGHMDRLRQLCLPAPAQGLGDHWDILMAIKARNTEEAERVLRKHLTRTLEHVGEIQKKHPDYFR